MKTMKLIGLALCALALTTTIALAVEPALEKAEPASLYNDRELSVDLFGTYINAERQLKEVLKTDARHGDFGAGIGVQYWLKRNFGAEIEAVIPQASDTGGGLFDYVALSALARAPIGPVAPYVLAGVGHDFRDRAEEFSAHFGLGIEYRLTYRFGAFVDSRYIWQASDRSDVLLTRFGVRITF